MQLLEVFPDLAQEKLKSSQIKRKSSLIQSTHLKAFVLQWISLCQGPSAKCSFWNSTKESLGHLLRCSWRVMDEGKSFPVQLDFLELLYLLQCPLLTQPFPNHNNLYRICEFSSWWTPESPLGQWIHGVQVLCSAIENLISLDMSLYSSQKTAKVICVNWDGFWRSLSFIVCLAQAWTQGLGSFPSISFIKMSPLLSPGPAGVM